ncbi:MAG: hypothetical protein RTU63_08730 [Candidatus Thorarchaeota archaeon]
MRVKLFVEPLERAREQVLLESSVPSDMKSFKKWQTSWKPKKEYKKWKKEKWVTDLLGEYRLGKILTAELRNDEEGTSLKGDLLAFRSFVTDSTGAKIKLPMVLFIQIKKNIELSYFTAKMNLDAEQEEFVKQSLKDDPLAPVSVWHSQPVDRRHKIDVGDVLPHAIKYAKALFERNLKDGNWSSFTETEHFK